MCVTECVPDMVVVMQELVPEPVLGDAFGETLRACHQAGQRPGVVFEVVERDDAWIGVTDAATYFSALEDWPAIERQMYPEITGRVLDIGCGAGRHATVLAAAGRKVIGVDPSPGAVEVARARGVDARQGSVTSLPDGIDHVDAILLFGHNIGLLGDTRQAPVVLTELARVAAPGARMIASGIDPYVTGNPDHLAYHERNRERGRLAGHLRLRVRHGGVATSWFDYVFRSKAELSELLRDSPWRLAETRHADAGSYVAIMKLR